MQMVTLNVMRGTMTEKEGEVYNMMINPNPFKVVAMAPNQFKRMQRLHSDMKISPFIMREYQRVHRNPSLLWQVPESY
jgi:hypothetical protein